MRAVDATSVEVRAYDVLAVHLTAPGYPEVVRLALPTQMSRAGTPGRLALISARTEVLIHHLEAKWAETFLDAVRLKEITQMIRTHRPLRAPVLGLPLHAGEVSDFTFVSGHHRIAVLHLLGAKRIPVAVPWHCTEDFLLELR